MTVLQSPCDASATMMNSESVTFRLSSKTGPSLSTRGARRDMTPADGYSGSSCRNTFVLAAAPDSPSAGVPLALGAS